MKHTALYLFIFFLLYQPDVYASELVKATRIDTRDLVQFYFSFDKTPKFKTSSDNRRVDLIFQATSLPPATTFPPADQNIVKILPRFEKDDLIISLFFRYTPQNYKLTESTDGKLVFETQLGNMNSKTFQDLSKKLKGVAVLERASTDLSNPTVLSPYAKDWSAFFNVYESPVELNVPIKFTLPSFPIIQFLLPGLDRNLRFFTAEMIELGQKGLWRQLGEDLLVAIQSTDDDEIRKMLALSFGETLVRSGDFEGAFKQLFLLKEKYNEELLGSFADFLLIHLRATHENPNIAEYEYRTLEKAIGADNPLSPYLYLAQIEAFLATGKLAKLNTLLSRDNIGWPEDIYDVVKIRQADYYYAIKQPIKAYAAYRLQAETPEFQNMPFALNNYCELLYSQKKFQESEKCYDRLNTIVTDKSLSGLISFRRNMARLKWQDSTPLIDAFSQIESAFPDTEAALRSTLKKNDLLFLQNKEWGKQAIVSYREIADNSTYRAVREEASFKTAVVQFLLGEWGNSIESLQKFLREFQKSDIKVSAQALLINILPQEIKRLIDKQEHMKALVLARKNKEFFEKNWLSRKLLIDIALTYSQVGLFDEAHKLYLYLIEITPSDEREQFYLPMINAAFSHGSYSLVEDYAAQYVYNYPDGKQKNEVLTTRLRALAAEGRLVQAFQLIPGSLPEDRQLCMIAASLYFRVEKYQECLVALKKLATLESPLPQREQFMIAESYFQTGAFSEAEIAFVFVTEENDFFDQSLYRLASLERKKGNEKNALSLFTKIVEKGKNPKWKQYAERELLFAKASTRKK